MSKRIQNASGGGQLKLEHFGTSSLGMAAEGTVTIYISQETSQTFPLYCTTKNTPVFWLGLVLEVGWWAGLSESNAAVTMNAGC